MLISLLHRPSPFYSKRPGDELVRTLGRLSKKLTFKLQRTANEYAAERRIEDLTSKNIQSRHIELKVSSLSKDVFEQRKSTGSEVFSLLINLKLPLQ